MKITKLIFDKGGQAERYEWWDEKGRNHREDGPAIIYKEGTKMWFIDGLLHREDGPAVEQSNKNSWYLHGRLHREGGPAIICKNGHKEWYLNGIEYQKEEDYWEEMFKHNLKKLNGIDQENI